MPTTSSTGMCMSTRRIFRPRRPSTPLGAPRPSLRRSGGANSGSCGSPTRACDEGARRAYDRVEPVQRRIGVDRQVIEPRHHPALSAPKNRRRRTTDVPHPHAQERRTRKPGLSRCGSFPPRRCSALHREGRGRGARTTAGSASRRRSFIDPPNGFADSAARQASSDTTAAGLRDSGSADPGGASTGRRQGEASCSLISIAKPARLTSAARVPRAVRT